jgi:hypothetical protein
MSPRSTRALASLLIAFVSISTACATNLPKASIAPQPVSVRLNTFSEVTLLPATIAGEYANSSANQKAARKINEVIESNARLLFTNLNVAEAAPSSGLVIKPEILAIKFIGGAARFWVGAMAGSSAVTMRVTLTDGSNGQKIGEAEYYRSASAFAGGIGFGRADNQMLEIVAQDIIGYLRNSQ